MLMSNINRSLPNIRTTDWRFLPANQYAYMYTIHTNFKSRTVSILAEEQAIYASFTVRVDVSVQGKTFYRGGKTFLFISS